MLPEGFPKWRSVHAYFQIWSQERDGQPTILEIGIKQLVKVVRTRNGRTEHTSFLVIGSQSIKNTATFKKQGYDAGKKVSGIKRHLAARSNGLPHMMYMTSANLAERTGAVAMVMKEQGNLVQVERVLVYASYTGKPFAEAIQATIGVAVEVVKRSELHTFKLLPKGESYGQTARSGSQRMKSNTIGCLG